MYDRGKNNEGRATDQKGDENFLEPVEDSQKQSHGIPPVPMMKDPVFRRVPYTI
jgi:hypothetical protein